VTTGTMDGFGRPRASAAPADAGLVLLYAPGFEAIPAAFPLRGDLAIVGREPPAGGLCIPQSAVSRLHARFTPTIAEAGAGDDADRAGWTITDLDSRNGVLVNGRFVREAALAHGDEVRIGDAIFKYVADEASAYVPYRIDGMVARRGPRASELVGGMRIDAIRTEIDTFGPTPLTVLVLGETGSGKELVARSLHAASGRRGGLTALNCAAIPANLVESELFGFRRGAFTGADRDHPGLVRTAHEGTLLLDEIGDMPLEAQAKLLRMLETREVVPLGAARAEKVDVRVVCATHRDLQALVDDGRFRADLFARIQGCTLTLPPLRARKEDLYALVRHVLDRAERPDMRLTFAFMVNVCRYDWPYNVRELEAAVRRAVAVATTSELDARHLPEGVRRVMNGYGEAAPKAAPANPSPPAREPAQPGAPAPRAAVPTESELRTLLAAHGGNVAAVARELGKDRTQIHRWLRMHAIAPDAYRDPKA